MAWSPAWVVAPGEVLYDHLDETESSVADMVTATELSSTVLAGVLAGTEPITEEIASALSKATGASVQFWLNLERAYREGLAAGRPRL